MFEWHGMVFPGVVFNDTQPWQHYPHHFTAECLEVIEQWGKNDNVSVHNPSLVLIAGIGAMTGMIGFWTINYGKREHKDMYRLPFFWFAFMNTTGLLCHCFFVAHHSGPNHQGGWPPKSAAEWIAWLDVCCSTCASLSFAFAALGDWRILKWERVSTVVLVLASYAFVFGGYIAGNKGKWPNAWTFLYHDVTQKSSIFYAISTVAWLGVQSIQRKKLLWLPLLMLVIGEGSGLFGLNLMHSKKHPHFEDWLCDEIGPNFGNFESFWYTCSDLGLIFLLLTFLTSHPVQDEEEPATDMQHLLLEDSPKSSRKRRDKFTVVV